MLSNDASEGVNRGCRIVFRDGKAKRSKPATAPSASALSNNRTNDIGLLLAKFRFGSTPSLMGASGALDEKLARHKKTTFMKKEQKKKKQQLIP